jgi:hypothetical protein
MATHHKQHLQTVFIVCGLSCEKMQQKSTSKSSKQKTHVVFFPFFHGLKYWLVVSTPLKNISQLG